LRILDLLLLHALKFEWKHFCVSAFMNGPFPGNIPPFFGPGYDNMMAGGGRGYMYPTPGGGGRGGGHFPNMHYFGNGYGNNYGGPGAMQGGGGGQGGQQQHYRKYNKSQQQQRPLAKA
jgi:hypothetical protein